MTTIGNVTARILDEIWKERVRQEQLKAEGKFLWSCADNTVEIQGRHYSVTNSMKLVVLAEEFGEAAREVSDLLIAESKTTGALSDSLDIKELQRKLRTELVQVAAVAVAWIEALGKQGVRP